MELVRPGGTLGGVHFVGDDQHRAPAAPEHARDLLVLRGQPRVGIDDEQHGPRPGDGALGLPPDLHDERLGGALDEPAGIDQHELAPGPLAGRLEAIAGHAGDVGDDRVAAGEQPVEQRGLPDIGPADDGHGGHAGRRRAVAMLPHAPLPGKRPALPARPEAAGQEPPRSWSRSITSSMIQVGVLAPETTPSVPMPSSHAGAISAAVSM